MFIVNSLITENDPWFVVDVKVGKDNFITVTLDSNDTVDSDLCCRISKEIEQRLDREEEDFSLTVQSFGVGRPLKLRRQYDRVVGKELEVLPVEGKPFKAVLKELRGEELYLVSIDEKRHIKKEEQPAIRCIPFEEIRCVKELIKF